MIDLHSHVLHAVDDGPESIDISLEMLQQASDAGIRAVVATPHVLDGLSAGYEESILSKFHELTHAVIDHKLDIDVYLGSEVYFQFRMEDIVDSSIGTYRGMGRYFLAEVSLTDYPKRFEETLLSLIAQGKKPIFAHPERIGPLTGDVETIENLVDKGVLIQMNSGSILNNFGNSTYEFSSLLLKKRLVHFVASDAHSTRRRSFNLDRARDSIVEQCGEDYAEKLLYTNPLCVLFNEEIV